MGASIDNIRVLREQNKWDHKTNPTGNADFKRVVLETYPGIKPNLFANLETMPDVNDIQRTYLRRFFFGVKYLQEAKLKTDLKALWNQSGKVWDKFAEAVIAMNEGSEELSSIMLTFIDENAEQKANTGKEQPFNVDTFLNRFIELADFDAIIAEPIAQANDVEYPENVFNLPDDFESKSTFLFSVFNEDEKKALAGLTLNLKMGETVVNGVSIEATPEQLFADLEKFEALYEANKDKAPVAHSEPAVEAPALPAEPKEALIEVLSGIYQTMQASFVTDFFPSSSAVITALAGLNTSLLERIEKEEITNIPDLEVAVEKGITESKNLSKRREVINKFKADEEQQQARKASLKAAMADSLSAIVGKLQALPADDINLLKGVSVPEFLAINGYPFNRDTVERIKKPHLKGSITSVLQTRVAVVKLDKERNADLWAQIEEQCQELDIPCSLPYMKLDGHSRAEAWSTIDGQGFVLEHPQALSIDVYQGESFTDGYIREQVKIYGSSAADLSSKERAQMASKELKLNPVSGLVKGSWANAFRVVGLRDKNTAEQEGRNTYKEALIFIDSLGLKESYTGKDSELKVYLPSGIKAGILKTWEVVDKEDAQSKELYKSFWYNYFKHAGFGVELEGVEAAKVEPEAISDLLAYLESSEKDKRGFDVASAATALNEFKNFVKAATRKSAK